MKETRHTRSTSREKGAAALLSAIAFALLVPPARGASPEQNTAARIMRATGMTGGLVVHAGCTDGRLTGALRFGERFIVHGLATAPETAERARKRLVAAGLHGEVAVHTWDGGRLPYVDGLVRLLVLDAMPADAKVEIQRVLCPKGVAVGRRAVAEGLFGSLPGTMFRIGENWVGYRKAWPETIDEWTHYLHDPSNNAVAADRDVGEPFHLQWVSGPKFARHHEHLSSVSGVVSAGGRLFSIVDEAPPASVMFPPEWFLVARDAFSGVLLWKRKVSSWHPHLWRFRTGPPELARRLVAVGDRVYATLTYDGPVVCLDAATGRSLRTYAQTKGAEEILVHGERVFAILGNPEDDATRTQRQEGRAAEAVEGLSDWAADVRGNAWDMDQEGDITGPAHLRDVRFIDGVLAFRTDNDPFLFLNLDGGEAGAEHNLLVVRMNCSHDGNGQVYYWSPNDDWQGYAFSGVKKGWHTYVLDLSQARPYGPGGGSGKHRRWGGSASKLHRLRFDPVQKAGADIEIDWVRLLKGNADVSQRLRELHLSEKKLVAIDARSGDTVWQRDVLEPMPTTLAVSAGGVFLQDAGAVFCLDGGSGDEKWRVPRRAEIEREGWSSPTLVVAEDVVLSADRVVGWEPKGRPKKRMSIGDRLKLRWPPSELLALSAADGQVLWRTQCGEGYHSAVDIFYADGLVWVGEVVGRHSADMTVGRDLHTGEVKRRLDSAGALTDAHHHRCYRNKATERFLVLGRTGIEFVDIQSGDFMRNHWVRGACQYGILPCNGLLYAPSHSCACYIQSKLNGFFALAGRRPAPPAKDNGRLVRGPAYQALAGDTPRSSPTDWPTYRSNRARSGAAGVDLSPEIAPAWSTSLGGRLTAPVIADGRVFVADRDRYTIHALSADSGRPIWSRSVGAQADSPPTVYGNTILFGCADGQVYCLRARDGELAWRRRISPEERFAVAFDRVESVWPVHGSVLIHDGAAYAVAGRSSYLDGGLRLCRLDPTTGRELGSETIYSRDPETGAQAEYNIRGMDMEGALPDILSTDGKSIFMRHARHAPDTLKRIDEFHSLFEPDASFHKRHPAGHPLFQNPDRGLHIFSPTGFLDDSWWHRTYWIYGTFYPSCCPYYRAGTAIPAGRILAFDESSVYGFGRKRQYWGWWTPLEYHLFSTSKLSKPGKLSPGRGGVRKSWQGHLFFGDYGTRVEYDWSEDVPLHVRAMVLAGRTLFVAGPPDVKDETTLSLAALQYSHALSHETMGESLAAWRGAKGARLRAISAVDGKTLREYSLDDNPVFDGMAAAGDRLILTTTGGKVVCMKASAWEPVTAETAKQMARQREVRRQRQVEDQAIRAFSEGFERTSDIDWNHVRGSFQYIDEMARSGRRSLKTILDDGGIAAHHADLLIGAGRYVLSGWLLIKEGKPSAPWAAPAVCETNWRPIAEAKVTEAGAWRRFEIPFELQTTRLVRINLNPRLHQSGLAGAVIYWDDIELRPAD